MNLSISKKILAWYKKHQRKLPWRKYKSQKDRHYKVLLSEFMLQQTQVKTVIPYFNNFYKNFDTIEKLSNAPQSRVNKLWQGLGYYRRAKFLLKTSKIISKKYNSKLPQSYNELIKLPGIGDYTAKALLSIAFNKSEIGIDGNVARVVSRLFCIKDKKKIPHYAEKLKVKNNSSSLMQGIMELGALVCKPNNPNCIECCLKNLCKFKDNKKIYMSKSSKRKIIKKLNACIYIKNKKILLTRKNDFGPLKGFLNVPMFENYSDILQADLEKFFKQKIKYTKLKKIKISISNFITEVNCIKIQNLNRINNDYIFFTNKQIQKNFKSSFLDKILNRVEGF
tara:strand:+ start:1195 stop:2205 length:1011 start_codon:yes stop_codon:yes gene_type:complete